MGIRSNQGYDLSLHGQACENHAASRETPQDAMRAAPPARKRDAEQFLHPSRQREPARRCQLEKCVKKAPSQSQQTHSGAENRQHPKAATGSPSREKRNVVAGANLHELSQVTIDSLHAQSYNALTPKPTTPTDPRAGTPSEPDLFPS
jgi:hypothetical protein